MLAPDLLGRAALMLREIVLRVCAHECLRDCVEGCVSSRFDIDVDRRWRKSVQARARCAIDDLLSFAKCRVSKTWSDQ
eukprot:12535431-Alexandrium_andersonii.AAC.1